MIAQESSVSLSTWDEFRSLMPICGRYVYFDHAAVAPLPGPTRQAIESWLLEATEDGDTRWPEWAQRLEAFRRDMAEFIGALPEEIALVRNTSHGISIVAEGFPWQAGDNVVIPAQEFPANQYPWLALESFGVEVRRVPPKHGVIDLKALEEACDARTRILSVSWVDYLSGFRIAPAELAALAHRYGAYFFLDAIQGLGVFPIDVHQVEIDFLAADGHKWLLGPEGAGVFYCRAPLWEMLRPTSIGWNSVEHPFEFDRIDPNWKKSAARFEGGSQNIIGFLGLHASLSLLRRYGPAAISRRVLDLTNTICEVLRSLGAILLSRRDEGVASGIVTFSIPDLDVIRLREALLRRRIVLSVRQKALRVSPHAYNNEHDVAAFGEALREAVDECRAS